MPTPSLHAPFVEVDHEVLLELYRKAVQAKPGAGQGSPWDPDLETNLWYQTFNIGR